MADTFQLLIALNSNRDAIEQMSAQLLGAASSGAVPCSAIAVYNTLQARQVDYERAFVDAIRAAGASPPEDTPRSFPIFAACPPGSTKARISAASVQAGNARFAQENERRAKIGVEIGRALSQDSSLQGYYDRAAGAAGATLSQWTVFTFGGSLWRFEDLAKLHEAAVARPTARDIAALMQTTKGALQAISAFAPEAPRAPLPLWVPLLGAAAVLGVGGGIWYAVKHKGREANNESGAYDDGDLE